VLPRVADTVGFLGSGDLREEIGDVVSMSAPAVKRAVELDRARRETCEAFGRWRDLCVSADFLLRERAFEEVFASYLRLRALEAEGGQP
jgi:hypothetical protein